MSVTVVSSVNLDQQVE